MVLVSLRGGLGNQMFQYALGRSLALRRRQHLYLLTHRLGPGEGTRPYRLHIFNIVAQVGIPSDVLHTMHVLWTVQERDCRFQSEIFDLSPEHICLDGFWQSDKYFREIASELLEKDFSFCDDPGGGLEDIVRQIEGYETVCLHVRRTDYLIENSHMGFVGLAYYKEATKIMLERIDNPFFIVFSDDLQWCRRNLRLDQPHIFAPEGLDDVSDFRLMTLCRHFIIANSTFSWWAAWLSKSSHKVVIAPKQWFSNEPALTYNPNLMRVPDSIDLVPAEWIRA